MNYRKIGTIGVQDSINKFNEEGEINFETYALSYNEEYFLLDVLKMCLSEICKENLYEYISYCFREVINNAKKANTKRIYFNEVGLNLNNIAEYKKGMKSFKALSAEKAEYYISRLEERGYYIRTSFKIDTDNFYVCVIDNSVIHEEELSLINIRKKRAREFKNISEALNLILNNKEGAGLGIIISIMMLKKMGLNSDNLDISATDTETITRLVIPLSLITEEHSVQINELLLKEIDELPQFPEHIMELKNMLNDPKSDIREISKIISRDPALTAEIIKFSNSALFSVTKTISSITDAIKIIGFRGLKSMIYSYGTKIVLDSRYSDSKAKLMEMEKIWDHSYKVAFFAFNLARSIFSKNKLEEIYIAGILHDLGKILVFAINPKITEKINYICQEKGIPIRIIEELSSGYNHSAIGGMIAKKWNFPESLISAIEYHHCPLEADAKFSVITYCINLANTMVVYLSNIETGFMQLNREVLEFFKIKSSADMKSLADRIESAYKKSRNNL
jgi:putative nucleotidyltransferase with HDIG domain